MRRTITGFLLGLLCVCVLPASAQQDIDLLLLNGRVFTADPLQPRAEAVAIRDGRIVAVGTTAALRARASGAARVVDVGGRTMIPGLNDAHWHGGPGAPATRLRFAVRDPGIAEVADSVAAAVRRAPAGGWIAGTVGDAILGDPSAARRAIDRAAPSHPVRLYGWTGHGVVYNRAAVELEGIAPGAPDPPGGWWMRDGDEVIGAYGYAWFDSEARRTAAVPDSAALAALRGELAQAAGFGLTAMQDMALPLDAERTVRLLGGDTPVRVRVIRWARPDATSLPPDGAAGRVHLSGAKWVLDGTPVERGAVLGRPYADRAGWHGRPYMQYGAIRNAARVALAANTQPMFHAVGDSTIALVIRALREVAPDSTWRRLRPRLEHADFLRPDQLDDARRLGLVVVQNPAHLMIPDVIGARLGAARMPSAQLLASVRRAGVALALGSDGPLNPFLNIMFATMHPGNPGEALTREEAVVAYTYGSAFAAHADDRGMIAPGMAADLAVLSQDIFSVPAQALPGTTSVLTIVDGRVVHEAM